MPAELVQRLPGRRGRVRVETALRALLHQLQPARRGQPEEAAALAGVTRRHHDRDRLVHLRLRAPGERALAAAPRARQRGGLPNSHLQHTSAGRARPGVPNTGTNPCLLAACNWLAYAPAPDNDGAACGARALRSLANAGTSLYETVCHLHAATGAPEACHTAHADSMRPRPRGAAGRAPGSRSACARPPRTGSRTGWGACGSSPAGTASASPAPRTSPPPPAPAARGTTLSGPHSSARRARRVQLKVWPGRQEVRARVVQPGCAPQRTLQRETAG